MSGLRTLISSLLFVFPLAAGASALASELRTDMQRLLQENELTGAVWSTVASDGSIAIDSAGVKAASTGEPLSADARVHVGSVAKTVLATGVLRLVSEGRLALDMPVSTYLPQLEFDNPWAPSEPIRLRHLLDHTAGLDDARLWQIFSLKVQPDVPLAATFARDPTLLRVRSRPGTRFSYSNMSYVLLGMVIESVTGQRYEHYLDTHLLRPLGMHDSTFTFVSQTGPQADARLAMGHFENGVAHAAVPSYLRPAAQFTTTAADMASFSRFLMSDGRINGTPFIHPALLRAMGRPFKTEAAQAGLPIGYGLGLARRDRHGVVGLCHSGNTVGFRAMLCLFPEHHQAFFIAMNADSETANYGHFDALLVKALGLKTNTPTPPDMPFAAGADWEGIYIPAPNRMASFAWLDTIFNFVRLSWDGDHLQLRSLQSDNRTLLPQGGLLFRATDRTTTSHVLLTSAEGKRVLSDGVQSYERISLANIALLWASLIAGILGLLIIVISGTAQLLLRRMSPAQPMFVPYLTVLALLLPLPLFLQQPFLQLGDMTAASVTLAVVTAALPVGMIIGLARRLRIRATGAMAVMDAVAMVAVLQWTITLASWNLVPLRLWH
jgi:CubicO group peptidase (beta-lactamase class C family)